MAKHGKGRGWHGNSEGHAAVARRKGRTASSPGSEKASTVTVKALSSPSEKKENSSQHS